MVAEFEETNLQKQIDDLRKSISTSSYAIPKVYTPEQVMNALAISRSTFDRYLKSGIIHSNKIGGLHRIPESCLYKLLKK